MRKVYSKILQKFTFESIEKNLLVRIVVMIVFATLAFTIMVSGSMIWRQTTTKDIQEASSNELKSALNGEIEKSNKITTTSVSDALSKQIDFKFNSIETSLKALSTFISVHYNDSDSDERILEHLSYLDTVEEKDMMHFIRFEDGKELNPNLHAEEGSRVDHKNRDWYKKTAQTQGFTISNYFISNDVNHNRVIAFAYPVSVNNKFVGVTGVIMTIDKVAQLLLNTDSSIIEDAIIISNDGFFIRSAKGNDDIRILIEENWKDVKDLQQESKTNGTFDGLTSYSDGIISGKSISIISPSKANWSVMMIFDFAGINDEISKISTQVDESRNQVLVQNQNLSIITLVSIFLAVILILVLAYRSARRLSKRITDPIVQIVNKIEATSDGDFEQDFSQISTGDEVEKIAKAMGEMMVSLQQHIETVKQVTTEKERTRAELDVAKTIQVGMLPNVFPAFPNREDLSLYASMTPAKEVGGDFYDFFFVDDKHIALTIADVSGKGVSAALFMAITKTVIGNVSLAELDPGVILTKVNALLQKNNDAMMFATCFLSVIDITTGEAKYANAGHNPPLIFRRNREIEYTGSVKDIPLALFRDTVYRVGEFKLEKHDRLILYTDGVTEAFDDDGVEYGTENLERLLNERATQKISLPNLTNSLLRDVLKYSNNNQFDDITILMFSLCNEHSFSSFNVQAEKQSLTDIYSFLDRNMDTYHAAKEVREKFMLIAEEIFVNIVDYAFTEDDFDRVVTVKFDVKHFDDKEYFQVTFADRGKMYDPLKTPDPDLAASIQEREIGGLGIFMSKKLSDYMKYERTNGKNVLRIGIQKEVKNA
jgi:sigma-B regulation protein RsbU (phosphoserine phosphatase)